MVGYHYFTLCSNPIPESAKGNYWTPAGWNTHKR